MSGFYGIGEVFVKVADLDRAVAFYHDLLGFEVIPRINEQVYIHLEPAISSSRKPVPRGMMPAAPCTSHLSRAQRRSTSSQRNSHHWITGRRAPSISTASSVAAHSSFSTLMETRSSLVTCIIGSMSVMREA